MSTDWRQTNVYATFFVCFYLIFPFYSVVVWCSLKPGRAFNPLRIGDLSFCIQFNWLQQNPISGRFIRILWIWCFLYFENRLVHSLISFFLSLLLCLSCFRHFAFVCCRPLNWSVYLFILQMLMYFTHKQPIHMIASFYNENVCIYSLSVLTIRSFTPCVCVFFMCVCLCIFYMYI